MGSGAPPLHPAPPSTEGREAANGGAGAERREIAISREVQSQSREVCISVELTKRNHALVLDPGMDMRAEYLKYAAQPRPHP